MFMWIFVYNKGRKRHIQGFSQHARVGNDNDRLSPFNKTQSELTRSESVGIWEKQKGAFRENLHFNKLLLFVCSLCLKYLTYDPNYNYDDEDDESMECDDEVITKSTGTTEGRSGEEVGYKDAPEKFTNGKTQSFIVFTSYSV